jgi:hypothetical protein
MPFPPVAPAPWIGAPPPSPWDPQPVEISPDTPLDDLLVEFGQTKPLADSYTRNAEVFTKRAAELKAAITAAIVREYVGDSLLDEDDPARGLTPEQRAFADRLLPGTPNYA